MIDQNYRILIARSADRSISLIDSCERHGIKAFAVPLTEHRLAPTASDVPELDIYNWVLFTSVTAVNFTAGALKLKLSDFPDNIKFAAVGKATAIAVATHFKSAEIVAEQSSSSGLAQSTINNFPALDSGSTLWICAERPVVDMFERLSREGYRIDRWRVYKTLHRPQQLVLKELKSVQPWDAIFFAAPSAVEAFVKFSGNISEENCIAIGNTTANSLAEHNYVRITVCASPEIPDVIIAIKQAVGQVE